MAYTSSPTGFKARANVIQAEPNSQTTGPAPLIQSGYPYPIFEGDLVTPYIATWTRVGSGPYTYTAVLTTDGYLHNYAEAIIGVAAARAAASGTPPTTADCIWAMKWVPVLGTFQGVAYTSASNVNPIVNAFPAQQFWAAGTLTNGNLDAQAYLVDDPFAVYDVQTGATGAGAANIALTYPVNYTWQLNAAGTALAAPYIQGTSFGGSKAFLDTSAAMKSVSTSTQNLAGCYVRSIAQGYEPLQMSIGGYSASPTLAAAVPYTTVRVTLPSSPFLGAGASFI